MKTIKITQILLLMMFSLNFTFCQSKKQNRDVLVSYVINNILKNGTDLNRSLVQMEVADLGGSYTGKCFDTFQLNGGNVSSTSYFNTPAGGAGGLLNNNIRKYNVSTATCADLGFSNGTSFGSQSQRPNPDDNFTFRMFSCDPNNNPCTRLAISTAGFN